MGDPLPTRVWYLAMDDPAALRPARQPAGVEVAQAGVPLGSLNRWLYGEIGRSHAWVDRSGWDDERWQRHAEAVETWLATVLATPVGFAELARHDDGARVDIGLLGVVDRFQGRGVGGTLLTSAIRRGWAMGAQRVTVDTCELDGPHALAHYRARGFRIARQAIELRRRPDFPVARLRDGTAGEAAELEALQLRASLVWEQYREQLEAHPDAVALPAAGAVRVAEDAGGRPLGFSVVLPRDDGAWELDGLFVEPGAQHGGIGSVLVNDVVRRAMDAGVARIDVIAGPAREFYEKLGFAVVGDAPTRFGPALALSRAV